MSEFKLNGLIDFKGLVSPIKGEGLEQLVRQIGLAKGLSPSWSGRGADGGRDMFFTEIRNGPLSQEKIRWLVSCKDKAESGSAVNERDLPQPGIRDKLDQHKANGFLLVTTTTISTGAKALLDGLDVAFGGHIFTLVWDASDLSSFLLESSNESILRQFFPISFQRIQKLESLDRMMISLQGRVPEDKIESVSKILAPYFEVQQFPAGNVVWPFNIDASTAIDKISELLLEYNNVEGAAAATDEIEFDAFSALIEEMHKAQPSILADYLLIVARDHYDYSVRNTAAQFLVDKYDLTADELLTLGQFLDKETISQAYGPLVSEHINDTLLRLSVNFNFFGQLQTYSPSFSIEDVSVTELEFGSSEPEIIFFDGKLIIDVRFEQVGGMADGGSFFGSVSGQIDDEGVHVYTANIDLSSRFPELER